MVKLMSFWGDVPCKILVQLAGFHQNRPCIPESPAKLKRSRTIPSCENHRLVVEKIHEVRKAANTQDGSAKVLRGFRAKGSTGLRRSPKKKCTDLAVLVRSSHARETAISETQSSNREWCWAMGVLLALWAVAETNTYAIPNWASRQPPPNPFVKRRTVSVPATTNEATPS